MLSFLKHISTSSLFWMVLVAFVIYSVLYNILHLPEILEQTGQAVAITHLVIEYMFPSSYSLFVIVPLMFVR